MPKQSELSTLRAELKLKLADGTYDPLAERIIKWVGRIFPRLPKGDLTLYLILSFCNFLLTLVLNMFDGVDALRERLSLIFIPVFMVWVGPFLYARLYRQLYQVLSEHIVDSMPHAHDLKNLSRALALFSNPFLSALVPTAYTLSVIFYIVPLFEVVYGRFGIGGILSTAIAQWLMGLILHHVFGLMLFPLVLSRYYIDLYELDPGASPSIRELSGVIRKSSYQISVYFTVFNSYLFYFMGIVFLPITFLFLTPLLGIFVFRQVALSRIVARARGVVLDRLRVGMDKLDVERHFDDPAIWNKFKAMAEYYDRVKNADSGVFDLRTGLMLINSLILPFTAFMLTQFNHIVDFVNKFAIGIR